MPGVTAFPTLDPSDAAVVNSQDTNTVTITADTYIVLGMHLPAF